eukprot:gene18932-24739_t
MFLNERIEYWSDYAIEADNSGTADEDYTAFTGCNCIKPWIDNDYSLDIEQKFYPENPPHIVFLLADDFGWNDIGYQSTYQSWTTPTIDLLASEGIKLSNYFTHDSCVPSRGALMTGRFSIRLGFQEDDLFGAELKTTEVTLAQELKSAGYRTNHVGKWHLGYSSQARLPSYRGFDYTYGYYNGYIDYYTKSFGGYLDLHENGEVVTETSEVSSDLHSAYLFQAKAEAVISNHAENYPDDPMFLYYALQLTHFPYEPPAIYKERCSSRDTTNRLFCGLTVMLDEVVANLTCALKLNDMSDNTVIIFASDNGGADEIVGNSVPFRGHKFSQNRGGISAHAFIHSALIPDSSKGTVYDGLMHVTDWLPTIMNLATEGEWSGSYSGNDIDGVDMWDAIINNEDSPKVEIVHYLYGETASISYNNLKYDVGLDLKDYDSVDYVTGSSIREVDHSCSEVSLMNDDVFVLPIETSTRRQLWNSLIAVFGAVGWGKKFVNLNQ